jgi:hypothetical protein
MNTTKIYSLWIINNKEEILLGLFSSQEFAVSHLLELVKSYPIHGSIEIKKEEFIK